jgi:hypothetical protein
MSPPWCPKALEENVSEIRSELQGLLAKGGQMVLDPAYPRLTSVACIGKFTTFFLWEGTCSKKNHSQP